MLVMSEAKNLHDEASRKTNVAQQGRQFAVRCVYPITRSPTKAVVTKVKSRKG